MVYHFASGIDTGGIRQMVIGRGLLAVCVSAAAGAMGVSNAIGFADTAKPVLNAKAKRGAAIFQQNCVSCHNKQPDTEPARHLQQQASGDSSDHPSSSHRDH
jgi:mono/diheme cytochrome c family protein